ncbi:HAD family hydrolase [Pantanalinema sp. GBBB05]|uniref:HAD family hydrolase n=1 Tax=Pantanalinema sp. GBBB05 TaxID=2604139 RepID=UPI001D482401|nr:HAD family hydrolase [Pantanalinema sp. GBBB05]
MLPGIPTVLALDFDGVLLNGLKEYFQTAWRAYYRIWHPQNDQPPAGLAETFYRLRPVVETGWEMPLVLRAILQGNLETELLDHWATIAQELLIREKLEAQRLQFEVDDVRDQWIATDFQGWLAEQGFYPGTIAALKRILATNQTYVVIISTKEGRFIRQLLQQQGIDDTDLQVYGKEVKRPKAATLQELMPVFGKEASIWFVEDRLQTLHKIQQQPNLQAVKLFLADWGYNTLREREIAQADPLIQLLSLEQFSQDPGLWINVEAIQAEK